MAFSHRSLERADAALKSLADSLPRALRGPIDRARRFLDPIRQREALVGKLQAKLARYEAQLARVKADLDHEHADLITARMKVCEVEEIAARTEKEAFDAALSQSKREESANQTSSVLTRELKSVLSNVSASLKLLGEDLSGRKDGESAVKDLEAARWQLAKSVDLVDNLRFFLKE